ncbi:5-bromo-4-chloroindolyl phosphate hydrolysis family protein [Marinicella gelatinilytica]|uniref:5-bromo-4-chloroindolyl phosphate hydrolysis family protein n=1 Tax=Marinicella gelatinilytica TaxID=2996017 RepID=UPI002260FBBB|nr:5-bromo-4-chloroindolyl phosphate hydrolysis family protein [Marinicella gelatinilytica]MCX7544769.1 5-bromo-4-chloroindolyl phosphate hydrolysis family protein [Marinicella gelatinilytica]
MTNNKRPVKYRERAKKTIIEFQSTAWLLYLYSVPFLFVSLWQLITGHLWLFLMSFGVFFGVLLSAVWMSKGRKNKYHFQQRKYTLKQPFPLMFLASLSLGVASFAGSLLVAGLGLMSALGHGVAATIGSWLWYGLDAVGGSAFKEVKDKDSQTILAVSEQSIVNIEQAEKNIDNLALKGYLHDIVRLARNVIETLVDKPEKIPQARRFLHSYLHATESVIERYAKTHKQIENDTLDTNFKAVLQNIVNVFSEQQQKLIENEVFDLDVDIEVLNTLLEKQGIS